MNTTKEIATSEHVIRARGFFYTKTQTRRVVKPQPPSHVVGFCTYHNPKGEGLAHFGFDPVARELQDWFAVCPYGPTGDRLWVRENFAHIYHDNSLPERRSFEDVAYMADGYGIDIGAYGSWKPSIHMPRWASRITLEITSVRVERLQDISEADAMAEGCTQNPPLVA